MFRGHRSRCHNRLICYALSLHMRPPEDQIPAWRHGASRVPSLAGDHCQPFPPSFAILAGMVELYYRVDVVRPFCLRTFWYGFNFYLY